MSVQHSAHNNACCTCLHIPQRLPETARPLPPICGLRTEVDKTEGFYPVARRTDGRADGRLRVRPLVTLEGLVMQRTAARVKQLDGKRCCQRTGLSMVGAYWRWTRTAIDPDRQRDSAENASNKTVHRSPRVPKGQREGGVDEGEGP